MTFAALLCSLAVAALIVRPWRVPARPLTVAPDPRREAQPLPSAPRWVAVVPLVVLAALIEPMLAVILTLAATGVWYHRVRKSRDRGDGVVARALPDVVDLLLLGVVAGLAPRETLARCQRWLPEPFDQAVASALRRADAGEPFADALDRSMQVLGERVRPLVAALLAGERDGAALALSLQRVSDEARRRRRVAAQERARRVPVTMLAPLLLCVLPSFALLTVAPLILGSLADLGLGN